MELTDFWFGTIAVLWIGYFFLEGFDFGVGVLLPVLGRTESDRRVMINTIGPVWDGNEVWVLVAGGATFAAFPEWYATLFSGFYLALLLILVALIVRGVAFEYRGKVDSDRWRANWDRAIFWGSALPALLWGVAFANIVAGVPIDKHHEYTGSLLTLLNPYGLLGGLLTLGAFTLHGAYYLALKTDGSSVRRRTRWPAGWDRWSSWSPRPSCSGASSGTAGRCPGPSPCWPRAPWSVRSAPAGRGARAGPSRSPAPRWPSPSRACSRPCTRT
jgi:cytochrome d ubiquinol oxidase subunit II